MANRGEVVVQAEVAEQLAGYVAIRERRVDDRGRPIAVISGSVEGAAPAPRPGGIADGQDLDEVYTYGSFLQSKMYARGVSCRDCHDSHSLKLRFEGNELCLQCHQREVYDSADHHFHKKIVDGKPSAGARCVSCHMAEQPFMVIDWRADHSIRVPRPDLTAEIAAAARMFANTTSRRIRIMLRWVCLILIRSRQIGSIR